MLTDLTRDELPAYRSSQTLPADFDAFWAKTLAEANEHDIAVRLREVPTRLTTIAAYDVTFRGFAGQDVRAWLRVPAATAGPLPTVVQYVGYGGGRGHVLESLLWASAGFAHLQMDTRGQGAGWSVGETPDLAPAAPQGPGVLTRGILDPAVNFARRATTPALFSAALMDAVCPPSTVYGAFNEYGGEREMLVWEYNGHEGGGILDEAGALEFLRTRLARA